MSLGKIDRGMKLYIFEALDNRAVSDEYESVFRYSESDKLFVVQSTGLFDHFDKINPKSILVIGYSEGPNILSFTGRAAEKLRGGLVMIEQLTEIKSFNRRKYDRDELRLKVNVYGVPEAKTTGTRFEKPGNPPDMTDTTFDVSAGGICIITNTLLNSKFDPYFLMEFAFSEKDAFLLPAKLVRRANYPRTKIGRYDYGFQFIYDKIPDEKSRLTRAILNRKLSHR
jgi:c-di-GMP-binding flagellar brake protein YcgR